MNIVCWSRYEAAVFPNEPFLASSVSMVRLQQAAHCWSTVGSNLTGLMLLLLIIIIIIIIMYIYHALINALSAHMIHINLNMIFYTHVEHSHNKKI